MICRLDLRVNDDKSGCDRNWDAAAEFVVANIPETRNSTWKFYFIVSKKRLGISLSSTTHKNSSDDRLPKTLGR